MWRKYLWWAKASIARRREKLNAYAREYYHNHKEIINKKAAIYQRRYRLNNKNLRWENEKLKEIIRDVLYRFTKHNIKNIVYHWEKIEIWNWEFDYTLD